MNKPSLDIITPVSRPNLLPAIEKSIIPLSTYFKVTWWTIYDSLCERNRLYIDGHLAFNKAKEANYKLEKWATGDPRSIIGNAQNNLALEKIPGDHWCYFLSDDNIIHEELGLHLFGAIKSMTTKRAFIFHQLVGAYIRLAVPQNIRIEGIDLAQFVLRRDFIGEHRFELGLYQSDGKLVETLYHEEAGQFYIIDRILSYYNRLR